MSRASNATVSALRAEAEKAAAETPNAIATAADAVKHAIRTEADPYVLAGALVEGIAMTVLTRIPEQKQRTVANDIMVLLYARLDSLGMFSGPPPSDVP